jgi:hypothetical protein
MWDNSFLPGQLVSILQERRLSSAKAGDSSRDDRG